MSGSHQDHLRITSGSLQGHVRVTSGVTSGVMSGSCQGHVRVLSGSPQGHVRVMSRSLQDHFRGHVRVTSGSCQGLSFYTQNRIQHEVPLQSFHNECLKHIASSQEVDPSQRLRSNNTSFKENPKQEIHHEFIMDSTPCPSGERQRQN